MTCTPRRCGWSAPLVLLTLATTTSSTALAQDVVAEPCEDEPFTCVVAPVTFSEVEALPIELDFDTGWVPPGSPLQVRIAAMIATHTRLSLSGALVADWPHADEDSALRLTAPGDPMGGLLGYHYGLATSAEAKLGLSVGPLNFNWQGPLPYVPQIDFQVQAEEVFDAWGWEPGVTASSSTMPEVLATVDLASVIGVSIPGLTGGFALEAAVDMDVRWTNHAIVLEEEPEASVAGGDIVMADGESHTDLLQGAFAEVDMHPRGTVDYDGTVHLIPAIYVELLGQYWSIPIVDIPIPFSAPSLELAFTPQRVHLPLPDVSVSEESIDFGVVAIGDESFRSYQINNDGELDARTAMITTDMGTFPLWETALEIAREDASWATLRFVPTHLGEHEAELWVASNDPDHPVHVVTLHGVGKVNAPAISVDLTPEAEPGGGIVADSGCGCRLAPAPSRGAWLLGLALVPLLRRRRIRPIG
ncbi:MAG: MYXO-CTERM sorting domain-containing protein [Polyangiaceae bacterium]